MQGEDGGEGEPPAEGEAKKKSGKPEKRLRNQFNFSERASQTLNNPYRVLTMYMHMHTMYMYINLAKPAKSLYVFCSPDYYFEIYSQRGKGLTTLTAYLVQLRTYTREQLVAMANIMSSGASPQSACHHCSLANLLLHVFIA